MVTAASRAILARVFLILSFEFALCWKSAIGASGAVSISPRPYKAEAYARGDVTKLRITAVRPPVPVDVKALRLHLGLSQEAFAVRYGFNVATLRDWEQGQYRPTGSARVLLTVIFHEHEAVERALAAHERMSDVEGGETVFPEH